MSRSITRFCVSGIEKNSEEIEKLKKIIWYKKAQKIKPESLFFMAD